jgi:hypothetical protein
MLDFTYGGVGERLKPPVLKTGAHTVGRGFESRPLRHLFTSKTDGIGVLESGYLEPFPREYLASQEIAFGGAIKPRCFVKLSMSRGTELAQWRHMVAPQFEPCPSAFQAGICDYAQGENCNSFWPLFPE